MFCNRFFFLLCTHGIPWANYSVVFPEKVWQCCNAAVWYEHSIMEFLYTIEPLKGKQNSTTLWGQSWLVKSLRQKPHLHVLKKSAQHANFWHRADDFTARHSQFSTCKHIGPKCNVAPVLKVLGVPRPEVVSVRVNEVRCQKFGMLCCFFSTCK